jgi:hypothetical protein
VKKIPKSRVVQKIMRPLPECFRPKVIAIEESKDLDTVRIEDLAGSLQTNELSLPQPKKAKSIVLKPIQEEANDSSWWEIIEWKGNPWNKPSKGTEKSKGDSHGVSLGKRDKGKKDKNTQGIKCHECSGFGHIRAECPN